MRHRRKIIILDRNRSQRLALLRIQANQFFHNGNITTTSAKAKFLRSFVEKLITKGKTKNLSTRRYLISKLHSKESAKNVMEKISPQFADRKGGYTRIIKLKKRLGDSAPLVKIELLANEKKSK